MLTMLRNPNNMWKVIFTIFGIIAFFNIAVFIIKNTRLINFFKRRFVDKKTAKAGGDEPATFEMDVMVEHSVDGKHSTSIIHMDPVEANNENIKWQEHPDNLEESFTISVLFSHTKNGTTHTIVAGTPVLKIEEEDKKIESPLETFIIYFENFNNIIFDNLSLNIFFNFFLIVFLVYIFISKIRPILQILWIIKYFNNGLLLIFSIFKNLIKNLRFERFFFFLLVIFIYLLFTNFGGFSLYELSFTSHAIIALFLSFIVFFNYFINILINFNEKIYEKFVQKNLNTFLTIILFFIELVSFFVRPFSLGIRLFANILSGHILIHIFFNAFVFIYKIIFWLSFLILFFCFFILVLEVFVACVQAYIYLILSFIYLQDVSKIHT